MKILGIDPGIERVGYALIEKTRTGETLIDSGCIKTPGNIAHEKRLLLIANRLDAVIRDSEPNAAAVEALFFSKNTKTALLVAEARGVILLTLTARGVPVSTIGPGEVKLALTGHGGADKRQVGIMVMRLLRLSSPLTPDDISDAAAIALAVVPRIHRNYPTP